MRFWGGGNGHCTDIRHWKYNGVYCSHFLPAPGGNFSQRQCGNYVKSISCKSLPRQINRFPPGVKGGRHRNCYSLILHVENHSIEEKVSWQNLSPDANCHYSWWFWGGRGKRKNPPPFFQLWKSVWLQSHQEFSFLSASQNWVITGLQFASLFICKLFQQLRKPLNKDILWPAWLCPFLLSNAHLIIALLCLQAILLLSWESQKVNTPLASWQSFQCFSI